MTPQEQVKRDFAYLHHGDQSYGKSDLPHTFHLERVVEIVKRYIHLFPGNEELMIGAAWHHDLIEDTEGRVTFEDLHKEFGVLHARLVEAVSNVEFDHEGDKLRRKAKAYYTYPKIRAAGKLATALKLADRIANVKHCIRYNHGMFGMYQKEYEKFRNFLKIPDELQEMWAELDVLMTHKVEDPV